MVLKGNVRMDGGLGNKLIDGSVHESCNTRPEMQRSCFIPYMYSVRPFLRKPPIRIRVQYLNMHIALFEYTVRLTMHSSFGCNHTTVVVHVDAQTG